MSERGKSGIYCITHTDSGKRYVGQAASIGDRWLTHRSALDRGAHHSRHLQRAWAKYGAEAFQFSVLEYVPRDKVQLAAREQHWMDVLKPEYNVAPAAATTLGLKHPPRSDDFKRRQAERRKGFRHSSETIEKLRAIAAEKKAGGTMYRQTPEHREVLRAANTGKQRSEAAIEKWRASMAGYQPSVESVARRSASNTGKQRTPEQRARIAAAKHGHGVGVKQSAETIEKRAAALRGKPRPQHVIDAMAAGRRRWLEAKRAAEQGSA